MTKEINTVLRDMPTTVPALVRENDDSTYTIVLNARLSRARQYKAYMHELEHIENDDFEKHNVDAIEMERHFGKKETPLTDTEIKEQSPIAFEYLKRLRKKKKKAKKALEEYENERERLQMMGVL